MRRHPVLGFVVLAIAVSWAWWIPLAVAGEISRHGIGWPTHLPGLLGPAVAALVVTGSIGGRTALRDLLDRTVRWRAGWAWLAVPAVLLAGGVGVLATGNPDTTDGLLRYTGIGHGWPGVLVVVTALVVNGFGEEIGWRGYAVEQLTRRGHGLLRTAGLVWIGWAIWHLPLFFVVESFRQMSPAILLAWGLGLYAGSILLAWLYLTGRHSILLVAVWHTAYNFTTATASTASVVAGVTSTLVGCTAVAIAVGQLRRRPRLTAAPPSRVTSWQAVDEPAQRRVEGRRS